MAAWSSTTLLVSGTFLADATRASSRSTMNRMSVATPSDLLTESPAGAARIIAPRSRETAQATPERQARQDSLGSWIRATMLGLDGLRHRLWDHRGHVPPELRHLLAQR